MTITPKNSIVFLYNSVLYAGLGVICLFYFYCLNGVNNIIEVILLFFFTYKFFFNCLDAISCKQNKKYEINIQNDIFYVEKNRYNLKNSYLYFELNECGDNVKVLLYQEKETKTKLILQNIIFSRLEFRKFLQMIKPYRKFNAFPWREFNTTGALYICNEGFIVYGREIFYNEVKSVDWKSEIYYKKLARFEEIYLIIELKNGEKIANYFNNYSEIAFAKIFYIYLRVKNEPITKITGHKTFSKQFNKILKELEERGCETV